MTRGEPTSSIVRSPICLNCGISAKEVRSIRAREGYSPGCGYASTSENGTEYHEIAPRHRWLPWTDKDLSSMGIKEEAFDKYRMSVQVDVVYGSCEDQVSGHIYPTEGDFDLEPNRCWGCGKEKETV